VAVAAVVKVARTEAIAGAAPQQRKALPADLYEECRTARDDQGSEIRGRRWQRYSQRGGRRCLCIQNSSESWHNVQLLDSLVKRGRLSAICEKQMTISCLQMTFWQSVII
jgi:hypothetical protein